MKKNVVQDVIPPKKSIRNVELPSNRGRGTEGEIKKEPIETPKEGGFERPVSLNKQSPIKIEPVNTVTSPPPINTPPYKYEYVEPKRSSRKKWLYVFLGLFILVVAFTISAMFKSAEIRVTPKTDVKTLAETFTAKKDLTTGGLGFQLVTVSKDAEKSVDAADTTAAQRVDKKAQGKIVIYNNYSTASQKLVATTRFQTPEGLVFRLISPVTVPGQQIKDGKTVAGSVEVTVEADKPGEAYNVALKDFTLPGLKGDPKYKEIYARSKTEMSGGFSGMQKVVSKVALDKANTELETSLKDSLSKDISSQIPANFVLYTSSLSYRFDPITQSNTSTGGVLLKKKGTTTGIIFDKGSLTRSIVSKVISTATADMIKIVNLENLNFTLQTPTSSSNIITDITFTLKGDANLVWIFDENKLKSDLLGLSKTDAKKVIASYPSIKEAWVLTRPFWNQSIPSNSEKVTLVDTLTP